MHSLCNSNVIMWENCRRREVSAEGQSRTRMFQNSHSCISTGSTTTTISSSHHHRSLRNSQDFCAAPTSETNNADRANDDRKGSERLIDWRRQSPDGCICSYDSTSRHSRSPEKRTTENAHCIRRRRLCMSASVPPSSENCSTTETSGVTIERISNEGRRGRLHFRRALSLFSVSRNGKEADKDRRGEKSPQKKILRPPTRHVYRRGPSGLPIECSKNLGLAY